MNELLSIMRKLLILLLELQRSISDCWVIIDKSLGQVVDEFFHSWIPKGRDDVAV